MLRLGLIENLRRVGVRIAAGASDRNRAQEWAEQMLDTSVHDPKSLILVIADMARSNPPMVSSFVAELARRLQGQSAALALPLTWIEQRLSESGFSIEHLVQAEAQEQAGAQVSISNTIGSLRLLGALDWREFVETMSVVEHKLREDPGGVYGAMDFATRDRYRHVVEAIARASALSESDVARRAIQLAHDAAGGSAGTDGDGDPAAHVGYYLIDAGRARLERAAGARATPSEALRRAARRVPLGLYVGSIAVFTVMATALLLAQARHDDLGEAALVALGVLLVVAFGQLAVGMVNWLATMLATPDLLPRMDFSRGLPPHARTLVVVPTMLVDGDGIDAPRRGAGSPLPREPGSPAALRPADRLPGCARGNAARRRGAAAAGSLGHRGAERQVPARRAAWRGRGGRRYVLPVSSPAPVQSAGAHLDGVRAQARQARGPECAAARRRRRAFCAGRRRRGPHDARPLRRHARHRYATAARRGAPDGQRDGAPAQSRARHRVRRRRRRRSGHARLRNPAAAGECEPSRDEPIVVRAAARRRSRRGSVYARRLRRLSGCLRRGLVHRQGHLRRRRVRTSAGRALSRKQDPEPRSARRLLRALGTPLRRRGVRGLSGGLWHRRPPPPSLDSRRLAAARVAAAARARSRGPSPSEPDVRAFAMETLRQPAPQPRACRLDAAAAARVDRAGASVAVDPCRAGDPAAAVGERRARATRTPAGRGVAATASCGRRGRGRMARRAGGADARVPALRGDRQPRRRPARAVADVRFASPAARVESVGRRWRAIRAGRRWRWRRCGSRR